MTIGLLCQLTALYGLSISRKIYGQYVNYVKYIYAVIWQSNPMVVGYRNDMKFSESRNDMKLCTLCIKIFTKLSTPNLNTKLLTMH